MTKGQVLYAERKAMEQFDKWNEVTGLLDPAFSGYGEMESVIHDAVHIGIQMTMFGKIEYDEDGNITRSKLI